MNRLSFDKTTDILIPLEGERGVRLTYPRDMTYEEWRDVVDRIDRRFRDKGLRPRPPILENRHERA